MIRDRLKNAVKKVALRAFNMEWDAEETRDGGTRKTESVFDPTKIPKIVDGSGDGVSTAVDKTKDAVKAGAEKTTEALKKGAEKTGEAFEKVGEKLKEIGK